MLDKGGSPGTNPGEPGVGMEWTSDYQKMQKKSPNLNNGKVAVVSAHHALLLHGGLLGRSITSL